MTKEEAYTSHPSKRDALDSLFVRVPGLLRLLAGSVRHVRVGSSLRRRAVYLQVKRVFAAMARSDVDLVELFYEPDAEVWMRSMTGVGVRDCYHGHEGVRMLYADIDEAFAKWSWSIGSIADGGDRIAVGGDFVGYGRLSGVKTELSRGATAIRLSPRGLVVWQEWFVEQDGWKKALEAVGLADRAVAPSNAD